MDNPYLCSGHMVKGQGQTVGLNFSISYQSSYESRSNCQLQTKEMQHLKILLLILPSNQADKTLNGILLLIEPPSLNFIAYA